MLIALDYDGTFTRFPEGWLAMAQTFTAAGHVVIGCTMRTPNEADGMDQRYFQACAVVYFSSRKGKREYLAAEGLHPNVWIDDEPNFIISDAYDYRTSEAFWTVDGSESIGPVPKVQRSEPFQLKGKIVSVERSVPTVREIED